MKGGVKNINPHTPFLKWIYFPPAGNNINTFLKNLHPRKLTWLPKMIAWKRWLLLNIATLGIELLNFWDVNFHQKRRWGKTTKPQRKLPLVTAFPLPTATTTNEANFMAWHSRLRDKYYVGVKTKAQRWVWMQPRKVAWRFVGKDGFVKCRDHVGLLFKFCLQGESNVNLIFPQIYIYILYIYISRSISYSYSHWFSATFFLLWRIHQNIFSPVKPTSRGQSWGFLPESVNFNEPSPRVLDVAMPVKMVAAGGETTGMKTENCWDSMERLG